MRSYDLDEVAEICAVGIDTVKSWIESGELEAYNASRKVGSLKPRRRVTEAALEKFMKSRSTLANADDPKLLRQTVGLRNGLTDTTYY